MARPVRTGVSRPTNGTTSAAHALVETALDCLHVDGLAGISVRAICARARLTPRYFYESFADLDELLVATVDSVTDEGLFTGLRVGVATGKALAQTLGISIAGLSSLDVLAHSVRYTRRVICTCVDARRKEVFWAFYRATPGGVQRLTDFRCAPAEHCAQRDRGARGAGARRRQRSVPATRTRSPTAAATSRSPGSRRDSDRDPTG